MNKDLYLRMIEQSKWTQDEAGIGKVCILSSVVFGDTKKQVNEFEAIGIDRSEEKDISIRLSPPPNQ